MNDSAAASSQRPEPSCQLDVQFWYRRVYALCQSRLHSATDAEDAAQETFLRGFGQIDQLRDQQALGGWLRRIACNVCVDFIRRQKVRETSPTDIETIAGGKSSSTDSQNATLRRLIEQLPEPLAEIVLLHYYQEMTYDQMAQWLGIARSTVNERLRKARTLLKQQLTSMENAR